MEKVFTRKRIIILGATGFIQFIVAGVYTALIRGNSNSNFLGFSGQRLILFLFIVLLAILCISCSYFSYFKWSKIKTTIANNEQRIIKIYSFLLVGTFIFFIITFNSPTILGENYDAYYERLFPLAASAFLLMAEVLFLHLISRSKQMENAWGQFFQWKQNKPVLYISSILLLTMLVSYLTKFGLLLRTRYWNVPGVPVSTLQLLLVVSIFGFLYFLYIKLPLVKNLFSNGKTVLVLAALVYIATIFIWGGTPLERHFFTLVPSAPSFQPYPYSDARVHDLGALSILMGKGIFFHNYTDKPLLMVIFAICHLFSGEDYLLLQNVLVVLLAFIPVAIYLLGEKFIHPLFGLLAAFVIIFQQKNAIQLATIVPTVNVKLEVTETFTLLGMVFLVLVLFLWNNTKSKKYLFLAGVLIASISLIRMNPLIYLPAICLLIWIVYRKSWREFSKQIIVFLAGFLLMFSPWIITGTNAEGVPWAVVKILDVVNNRVTPTLEEHQSNLEENIQIRSDIYAAEERFPQIMDGFEWDDSIEVERTSIFAIDQLLFSAASYEDPGLETTYLYLFANHLIHNIDTLFLSLPDGMIQEDISSIADREYFHDRNAWNGVLPGKQIFLILINFSIFTLGLFYSWKKHSWSGLIPAFCLFTYVLSLSIALTSGGRYIVPINWIVYFYYLFGFVFLFNWVAALITSKREIFSQEINGQIAEKKQSWVPILILTVLFASIIPAANKILPLVLPSPEIKEDEIDAILADLGTENSFQEAILFYPYSFEERFSFDIELNGNIGNFEVSQRDILEPDFQLKNQELVLFSENENSEVTQLIVMRDNEYIMYIDVGHGLNE